jgi:hypothetical protein
MFLYFYKDYCICPNVMPVYFSFKEIPKNGSGLYLCTFKLHMKKVSVNALKSV